MAFMSVDLPAPFVPMRPTISASLTSTVASSTAAMPPKWTTISLARSAGTPAGSGARSTAAERDGMTWRRFVSAGPSRRSAHSRIPSRNEYPIWMSPPGK